MATERGGGEKPGPIKEHYPAPILGKESDRKIVIKSKMFSTVTNMTIEEHESGSTQ